MKQIADFSVAADLASGKSSRTAAIKQTPKAKEARQ